MEKVRARASSIQPLSCSVDTLIRIPAFSGRRARSPAGYGGGGGRSGLILEDGEGLLARYGRLNAMNSAGRFASPMPTTMYCFPSAM